jgi:hypothetical protein
MKNKDQQPPELVGMYAFLIEEGEIKAKAFITGRASEEYYIVQAISPLDGAPNVARLMTCRQLAHWYIIPTRELVDEIVEDTSKHGRFRYSVKF